MPNHEIITSNIRLPVYFNIYKSYNQLIPSHWHNHLEILYILQGTMYIVRNDEKYTLNTNELFVVNSGDIHLTRSPSNVEVLLLQVPYELLNHSIPEYKTIRFREYFPQSQLSEDSEFQKMIQYLLAMKILYEQGEDGYGLLFTSNLNLFLHTLYRHYATRQDLIEKNKAAKHLSRLKEVIDYVEQNYMESLSLKKAASLVALNPEYFCRSFKKYTGFTFMEYVNLVRLTHIHSDILDTDDSITSIQERHGFTNYKVFNRMFKESFGCTPSKLRSTRLQ
ncbi:helix-turn-helix transcriptional regulator [Cellulosilyticum sp. I15G10I2]|uniref:helix-turn-helix transcriptional regulator n=1 Tax=Cellulosilyticum sp. I15G10I2 TaxID=1892843 RepID=UPI00085BCD07|nr:AraC family transcriptional regulator [Cellulosilyticum sp. I15G10I2]